MQARYITLLDAARRLLEKCGEGSYVKDAMTETVFYDGVECDGYCLMEDITEYLEDEDIKDELLSG